MSTDLETDLRREFDTVRPPASLTFSPESVMSTGKRTIRRRRLMATGTAAAAVVAIAAGATLLSSPIHQAEPRPATSTSSTGIARAQAGFVWGHSDIQFSRGTGGKSNVRFSVVGPDEQQHEMGVSSSGKPGLTATAVWKSAMVDGHPVTFGVFPGGTSDLPTVTFADGNLFPIGTEDLKGTGYQMFYVDYTSILNKEPARPSTITSLRWSGPSGVIDGVEGNHRLSGRVFTMSENVTVDVVLRPAEAGRTTVYGQTHGQDGAVAVGFDLSAATTDPSGAAVATGRTPVFRQTALGERETFLGAPLAAGILPRGSSNIGVILTTGDSVADVPTTDTLPDGTVIFAVNGNISQSADPGKDSIEAVTWTNADGTPGRFAVTQQQGSGHAEAVKPTTG